MSKDPFLYPKWKLGIETFKTNVRVSRLESNFELKTIILETRDQEIWSWDSVSTIQDQKIPRLSSLKDFKTSRLETLVAMCPLESLNVQLFIISKAITMII